MSYYCAKCKVAMEEADEISVSYNDMELPSPSGLVCPSCGMNILLEQLVIDEVNPAEMMLETK